ncbi:UV-damaged DNA-binding protein rad7, partial [Coemansia sp. RSA 2671]
GAARGKGRGKKKPKKDSDSESDFHKSDDEADQREGLNRSSARKGGHMRSCEVCNKRFLQRGEYDESDRLLCPNCQRSVDKAQNEVSAVSKRARAVASSTAAPKRRRLKKTADGLLELEAGLPSLQDLCVRAIAKHVDQVESFGDISVQSLNKLCRIICKMRVLDESTLGLFLGADRTSVVLYDCTRLARNALERIVEMSPNVQTLALEYCGRLDAGVLDAFGTGLRQLAKVQLEGAFLVDDKAWAKFFREAGPRLRSFQVRFSGFGPAAMRALITHCEGLEELRVSECTDFNDDCLGMLAAPLTETEEALQEPERLLRDTEKIEVVPWRPLARLKSLDLGHPHLAMSSATATRVIRALGSQLRVLNLSGFKDVDDNFLLLGLAPHSEHLQELSLAECNSISVEAMTQFFAQGADATMGRGLVRLSLNRCYLLTDAVLHAVVRHSCCSLRSLDLNSVDDFMTEQGLLALAGGALPIEGEEVASSVVKGCPYLEDVDLSWVRCTTDSVLEKVLEACGRLEKVMVYGCPEVSIFAPTRPGLSYVGRVCDTL